MRRPLAKVPSLRQVKASRTRTNALPRAPLRNRGAMTASHWGQRGRTRLAKANGGFDAPWIGVSIRPVLGLDGGGLLQGQLRDRHERAAAVRQAVAAGGRGHCSRKRTFPRYSGANE